MSIDHGKIPLLFSGPPPEDAAPLTPCTTMRTVEFRMKAGRLQQLHNDPHGGDRCFWLYVPTVDDRAPDVV